MPTSVLTSPITAGSTIHMYWLVVSSGSVPLLALLAEVDERAAAPLLLLLEDELLEPPPGVELRFMGLEAFLEGDAPSF